mgnify:CR=1 FL=1
MLREMDGVYGEGWGDVMQYGWFWFVSRPLNFLLNTYHGWLDGIARKWSWGLAIILLTLVIKLLTWPFNQKSYANTERMKEIQPLLDDVRKKYENDQQRLAAVLLQRALGHEQGQQLARADVQADVVQRVEAAEMLGDVLDGDAHDASFRIRVAGAGRSGGSSAAARSSRSWRHSTMVLMTSVTMASRASSEATAKAATDWYSL